MGPPMEAEPSYWFALAAEDADHHAAVTRLTDRLLGEAIEWFQPETRDAIRRWRRRDPLSPYWKVTSAEARARELGLPLRGHFTGKRELEAVMYRSQLLVWQHAHVHGQHLHVGFIVRDTDHRPRRDGAVAAVKSSLWPFRVVLAFPHPEIEAWPVAVFEPRTKGEHARVQKQERQLGYSPVDEPERLTSTVSDGIADAKNVRDALVPDDGGGDWLEVDLEVLRDRGRSCGLTDFLREVEAVVVPLLAGGPENEGADAEVPPS
jgi:hypothetical protein